MFVLVFQALLFSNADYKHIKQREELPGQVTKQSERPIMDKRLNPATLSADFWDQASCLRPQSSGLASAGRA